MTGLVHLQYDLWEGRMTALLHWGRVEASYHPHYLVEGGGREVGVGEEWEE